MACCGASQHGCQSSCRAAAASKMAPDSEAKAVGFQAGLEKYLAEVRHYALTEVSRLERMLAMLSKDLAVRDCAVDWHDIILDEKLPVDTGHVCNGLALALPERLTRNDSQSESSRPCKLVVGNQQVKLMGNEQPPYNAEGPLTPLSEELPLTLERRQCMDVDALANAASQSTMTRALQAIGSRFSTDTQLRKQRIREVWETDAAEEVPADCYHEYGYAQHIVRSAWFENSTMTVVLLNALWIAIDLDLNPGDGHPFFTAVSQAFCTCFTSELAVRFAARRAKHSVFCDRWFLFDFCLVALMVVEVWIVPLVFAIVGGSSDSALGSASVLRLLRLLRVTRMAKAMRAMPELMIMIKGILTGLRSVAASLILLGSFTYLFAILFRQLAADTTAGEHFATVPESAYALFVQSCLPDNGDFMNMLFFEHWYLGCLFVFFMGIASMTIMNMLIGVMCEVMRVVSDDKQNQLLREKMIHVLRRKLQEDGNDVDHIEHHLMKEDLLNVLDDHDVVQALQKLHVDVLALVEDADVLFDGTDNQGLSFQEFTEVIVMFHDSQGATYRAMSGIRKRLNIVSEEVSGVGARVKHMSHTVGQDLKDLQRTLDEVQREVSAAPKGNAGVLPIRHLPALSDPTGVVF
eukprot:TRINITY_DN10345_c0_g1_i1.p1 TRINITY_DN10345_c0_g1~~TRINITY_DN10345_c0_g1_i1.p1  ORF type:complete len:634 (+),score=116.42 TRINITY_DN10345_c0_g1_i1:66-1967(+)